MPEPIFWLLSLALGFAVFVLASRQAGWRTMTYLALDPPQFRQVIFAIACAVMLMTTGEGLLILAHLAAHQNATVTLVWQTVWPSSMAIASLVILAPVAEETLFRGFLFRGWAASLGVPGTVALTATLFALAHTQYRWNHLIYIFFVGLLLGWLRHRSHSTILTIGIHAFFNAKSFVFFMSVSGA